MRKLVLLVHYPSKGIRILTNPANGHLLRLQRNVIANPSKEQMALLMKEGAHRLKIKNKKLYLDEKEVRKHNLKLLGIAAAVLIGLAAAAYFGGYI